MSGNKLIAHMIGGVRQDLVDKDITQVLYVFQDSLGVDTETVPAGDTFGDHRRDQRPGAIHHLGTARRRTLLLDRTEQRPVERRAPDQPVERRLDERAATFDGGPAVRRREGSGELLHLQLEELQDVHAARRSGHRTGLIRPSHERRASAW